MLEKTWVTCEISLQSKKNKVNITLILTLRQGDTQFLFLHFVIRKTSLLTQCLYLL